MANESEGPPVWFFIVLAVAALLGGSGLIVAAVKIVMGTAPVLILSVTRFLLIGLVVVFAAIIASRITAKAFQKTMDEIASLSQRHPKQFVKIKKRTPTMIAVAILVSEAVVIIADRSFEGNKTAALGVSFVMLIGFSMANELMVNSSLLLRIAGVVLWLLIVAFVPGAIMIDRKWGLRELGTHVWSLPMATKLFFVLAALVMTILPFLVARLNESEELIEVKSAA